MGLKKKKNRAQISTHAAPRMSNKNNDETTGLDAEEAARTSNAALYK